MQKRKNNSNSLTIGLLLLIISLTALWAGCKSSSNNELENTYEEISRPHVELEVKKVTDSIDIVLNCSSPDKSHNPLIPEFITVEPFRFLTNSAPQQIAVRISTDSIPFRDIKKRHILMLGYFEIEPGKKKIRTVEKYDFVDKGHSNFILEKDSNYYMLDTFPYRTSVSFNLKSKL